MTRKNRYNKKSNKKRTNNARYSSTSGAGGCGDRGNDYLPMRPRSQRQYDEIVSNLYFTDWQSAKIVDIPVEDMLRHGWDYEGEESKLEKLNDLVDQLDVVKKFEAAMKIERLMGGAVILMGIKSDTGNTKEPLLVDSVKKGDLTFLNVVPRHRVTMISVNNDPMTPQFGKPSMYMINGIHVHESRLLIFDGSPLTFQNDRYISPTNHSYQLGFGQSVLIRVIDDLARATGSRQGAFHLINMASVLIAKTDLTSLEGTNKGDEVISELQRLVTQISMYNMALFNEDATSSTSIEQHSASFGSVPELLMSFLQVLSAAGDIPATRFLSQAPGGLNSSGDGDLENYYGRLESDQQRNLLPQIKKFTLIAAKSAGVEVPEITFEPLWTTSELDESTIRAQDTANIVSLAGVGIITEEEAYKEAKMRDILMLDSREEDSDDILTDLKKGVEDDNAA